MCGATHRTGRRILVVSLGLPPSGARAARVQLAYDAKVLAAVDTPSPDAGRLTIDLDGVDVPLARVRFRVIAQSPATTQLGIGNGTVTDARGARLTITSPDAHEIWIVRAEG